MTAIKLSPTALALLTAAAEHPDRIVELPTKLPVAARLAVTKSLLRHQVAEWDEEQNALRITDAGFRAIGQEPPAAPATVVEDAAAEPEHQEAEPTAEAAQGAPTPPAGANGRDTLRHADEALLDALDRGHDRIADEVAALRAALATPAPAPRAERTPRTGTKQEQVRAMLRRPEGASGPQIAEATGWNDNTVRGFLAGLRKKGFTVETLDRVRMVGPNKTGARGSYTTYRIA
nr:DUF3489 domain-containing protein [uncultured Rhodopila sp.]